MKIEKQLTKRLDSIFEKFYSIFRVIDVRYFFIFKRTLQEYISGDNRGRGGKKRERSTDVQTFKNTAVVWRHFCYVK